MMILVWLLTGVLALILLLVLYLLFWPVPINPTRWAPPEAPRFEGDYATNHRLADIEQLNIGDGVGPEDVAIDAQGRIYTGVEDGRILRLQPDRSRPEAFAETGGRPLGLAFDASGNLLVADGYKGLLSVDFEGTVSVLANEHAGQPLGFANNLDVAADGTVYFSQTSTKFTLAQDMVDILENRPNGRLLAFDPKSRKTRLILDSLHFANGVAVSPDQSFVLVAESNRYRIRRIWLAGAREGEVDTFIDNLPGFPDNIKSNGLDIFWVALPSTRQAEIDALYARPFRRKLIFRLPGFKLPSPNRYGFVLGLNLQGEVVQNLQDPSGEYAVITSAREHGGYLYLGSTAEGAIGRIRLPKKDKTILG